ncbi:hypothetical protein HUS23_09010 [Ectothiorhodospiraceae bacterium 2226]|nr:hypothetical protein HUS23_09010 [Ectothiorhodospiraceae bacterium 2226]
MSAVAEQTDPLCRGCVYHQPNLPPAAYAPVDWQALQALACAYDCVPGDALCRVTRKTHCNLLDLRDGQPKENLRCKG